MGDTTAKRGRLSLALATLGAAVLLGGWLLWSLAHEPPEQRAASSKAASEPPAAVLTREHETHGAPPSEPAAPVAVHAAVHVDDSTLADRPRQAHPLDAAHEYIFRENALIQRANDAMDLGRADELRKVLVDYHRHDPTDETHKQLGYALIADCLDRPSADTRARAEDFITRYRASTLRRFVRRHCKGDR